MRISEQRGAVSFRELYEEYLPMVYRVAFTYMKNRYDSEDAAHETFLRLMKCDKPFKDQEHVKAWLIVTATNVCRDMLRRKHRDDMSLDDRDFALDDVSAEKQELLQAVMALPESYKTVVYMYYYEGYSVTEIAKALDKPAGTVKTWLSRSRKQLKEFMGGEVHDGYQVC